MSSGARRSVDTDPTPQPAVESSPEGKLEVAESGTFVSRGPPFGSDAVGLHRCAPSDPTARLARRLGARIVRPSEAARTRGSLGAMGIPDDVLLLPDGCAIAAYEGEPLLRYRSLARLCEEHGLTEEELVED